MTAARGKPALWMVIAAFAAVYLIWGSTYLAIRVALETLPPFLMAGVRFLIAGSILYAWVQLRPALLRSLGRGDGVTRPPAPTFSEWRAATIVGALLLLGGNGAVVWSQQWIASGLAALLVATEPLWVVAIDWFLRSRAQRGGSRPRMQVIVGMLVGFAGIVVLIDPRRALAAAEAAEGGFGFAGTVPLFPALGLLFASLSWAAGSLYSRDASLPSSPILSTSMSMLAGGVFLTLAGLLHGELAVVDPAAFSLRSVLALAYLIVFGAIVAFSAYVWLLRNVDAERVATYAYVNPVIAVLLGWAILAEPLTSRVLAAAVLVVGAVVLVSVNRRRRKRSAAAAVEPLDAATPVIAESPRECVPAQVVPAPAVAVAVAEGEPAACRGCG